MTQTTAEVLEQLDSACRYLFPDRPPHKAFDMAKTLIESLQRRVVTLETVIYEDLPIEECSDSINLMIVDEIIKRGRPQYCTGKPVTPNGEPASGKKRGHELVGFLAIYAVNYQKDYGLNGLHPTHYDLMVKYGARMVDFQRATNVPAGREPLLDRS